MLPSLPPCLHLLPSPQSIRGTAPSNCRLPQTLSYRELTKAQPHLRGEPGQTHVHLGQAWEAELGRVGDTDTPCAHTQVAGSRAEWHAPQPSPCPVWPLSPQHLSPPHRWSPCNGSSKAAGAQPAASTRPRLHLPEGRPTCCPFPSERPGNGGWERGPPPWEEDAAQGPRPS